MRGELLKIKRDKAEKLRRLLMDIAILDGEIKDAEYLLERNCSEDAVRKIMYSTTSSSIYDLLTKHAGIGISEDVSRCANDDCPRKGECLRSLARKTDKAGIYTYSIFNCDDKNDWEFLINK